MSEPLVRERVPVRGRGGRTADRFAETFAELAGALVSDFDVLDFLHLVTCRCAELLDVDAAALILADQRGRLRLVAASSEGAREAEPFQLQADEGPCLECFSTGRPVASGDLGANGRWPRFAAAAVDNGLAAVQALPMRLGADMVGVLNLFSSASVMRPFTGCATMRAAIAVRCAT